MMGLTTWWIWLAAALVLAILEVLAPGYVLLGFAIGAGLTGGLLFLSGGAVSWAVVLVVFAFASLTSWLALRRFFALKTGSVRNFDHDINEG